MDHPQHPFYLLQTKQDDQQKLELEDAHCIAFFCTYYRFIAVDKDHHDHNSSSRLVIELSVSVLQHP